MPEPPSELPDHQVTPNPKLEKLTRRHFSTAYKLCILAFYLGSYPCIGWNTRVG